MKRFLLALVVVGLLTGCDSDREMTPVEKALRDCTKTYAHVVETADYDKAVKWCMEDQGFVSKTTAKYDGDSSTIAQKQQEPATNPEARALGKAFAEKLTKRYHPATDMSDENCRKVVDLFKDVQEKSPQAKMCQQQLEGKS